MSLTELGNSVAEGLDRVQCPLTDEQLNAVGDIMSLTHETATKHKPPLTFLVDLGPAYTGPIIPSSTVDGIELVNLGMGMAKTQLEHQLSLSTLMAGWRGMEEAFTEKLAEQKPCHMSDEAVDECQRTFYEAMDRCNTHQLPALLCATFGRYGSGEHSRLHNMMIESETASESFTGLDLYKAMLVGSMDSIQTEIRSVMRRATMAELLKGAATDESTA